MVPQADHEKNKDITGIYEKACIDFKRSYKWFDKEFTDKLISSSREFIGPDIDFTLTALTNNPFKIWINQSYFVSQINIGENCLLYLRISNDAASVLLDSALGTRKELKGELQLKNISELEANILTSFNNFLFKNVRENFINEKKIKNITKSQSESSVLAYIVYHISSKNNDSGKIILSFPEFMLKTPELTEKPEKPFNIMQFKKCTARVNVFVGKTVVSLEDIMKLELDDIVILEKSNIHAMAMKDGINFKVNPDPNLVINVDDADGELNTVNGENLVNKNIWDSLQVEVNAEFQHIKMTLGELKDITEGLVIDVAPIAKNHVALQVDGRKIASGELVIIGDRYGVKLTKIIHEPIEKEVIAQNTPQKPQPQPVIQAETVKETDDDFDYGDFEIDDDI